MTAVESGELGSVSQSYDNVNPKLYSRRTERERTQRDRDNNLADPFDSREIFDLIRDISDPEHPLTLEQLNVVQLEHISVDDNDNGKSGNVVVKFRPTISHCSMASLIGLSIKVQLMRTLPPRFKVSVVLSEGSHQSEEAINKQLSDKERVAAALENNNLIQTINQSLANTLLSSTSTPLV